MKLSELKEQIDRIMEYAPGDANSEVVIAIKLPWATVGAKPMKPITGIMQGFDWEQGKIILSTDEPLTPYDKVVGDSIGKIYDKLGFAEYQNKVLEGEIKELKKELGELKDSSLGKS